MAKLWQALGQKAYYIDLYELIRVDQRNHNPRVGDSSPSSATIESITYMDLVSQLKSLLRLTNNEQ